MLPVLAVDMDEVLCATTKALVAFHNEAFESQIAMRFF